MHSNFKSYKRTHSLHSKLTCTKYTRFNPTFFMQHSVCSLSSRLSTLNRVCVCVYYNFYKIELCWPHRHYPFWNGGYFAHAISFLLSISMIEVSELYTLISEIYLFEWIRFSSTETSLCVCSNEAQSNRFGILYANTWNGRWVLNLFSVKFNFFVPSFFDL